MLEVKNNNKKGYGLTAVIAAAAAVIAAALAIIFGVNLPYKNSFGEVTPANAAQSAKISALVQGYNGDEYFIVGKSSLEKRRAVGDELICKVDFKDEIESFVDRNDLRDKLINGSLVDYYGKYVTVSENERYLLVFDGVGNTFKFEDTSDGLVLTDDYYLTDLGETYGYLESTYSGNFGFLLFNNVDGAIVLRKFNVSNLKAGELASKYIWSVEKVLSDGSYQLTFSSANVKIWDMAVSGDYIYLAFSNGIYKMSQSFADYEKDGLSVRFFEDANDKYLEIYNRLLFNKIEELELNVPEKTDNSSLEAFLKENGVKQSALGKLKRQAREAVCSAEGFEWCDSYDGAYVTINKDYCSFESFSQSKYGASVPFGVAFDSFNEVFYVAGVDKLYSLSPEVLGTLDYANEGLSDGNLQEVSLNSGGKNLNSISPVVYNPYSKCLYVAYENSDIVSIVNVASGSPEIIFTFSAGYNLQKQIGDSQNKSYHFLSISAADKETYVYSLSPEKSAHGSLFKTLLIIFIAAFVVAAIVAAIAFYGYNSQKGAEKLKVIKTDLIKHKGVYLALVPFVVLICLFCYYEAIGSISFSFYEYTQEKPTRNWNNFNNYREILSDSAFWSQAKNMLFFLFFDILFAIVPPVLFAFMLTIMTNKGYSKLARTLLFIPGILPGVATMLIWKIGIFGDSGVLNQLASSLFGVKEPIKFLANESISVWSLLLMGFPYVGTYLIFYGGMMNIPSSYYEAAELEGVSVARRLFQIDIPLIVSQLKYVFITTFINSVQNYSRTYMLGSAATTPAQKLYENTQRGNYGKASAYAVLIFIFLLAAMIINFRSQKKDLEGSL